MNPNPQPNLLDQFKQAALGEVQKIGQGFLNGVGQLANAIPSQTFHFDNTPQAPAATPNPYAAMKLTTRVLPGATQAPDYAQAVTPTQQPQLVIQRQPTSMPSQLQAPQPNQNQWSSNYQPLYDKYLPQKSLNKSDEQVLVTSENGKEDPGFQNFNYDKQGKKVSVDTGLLQVNTPLDSPEISQLKDPEYNINKGLAVLHQRNALLGDPVLAIASYNKGAGGAVLDPMGSLNRAKKIYANAGVPLPDTPFTRDPQGFVRQNMETYRKYGLFK